MALINIRSKNPIIVAEKDSLVARLTTSKGDQLSKTGIDQNVDHEDFEIQLVLGGKPDIDESEPKVSIPESIRAKVDRWRKR